MKKYSKEQAIEWKKEHFQVFEVNVGSKGAVIAFPNWRTWKQAAAGAQDTDESFVNAIVNNGFLYGDENIAETEDEFFSLRKQLKVLIEFGDKTIERKGNFYLVTVGDKVFKCKPVTREISNLAQRSNPDNKDFVTNENILKKVLMDGDKEVLKSKNPYYYVPLLEAVGDLHEKLEVRIKKL